MSDIERLCDRVLVVDQGRLVYDGTLADLAARVALHGCWWSTCGSRTPAADRPTPSTSAASWTASGSGWRSHPRRPPPPRCWPQVSAQVEVRDLTLEEPAIEDIVRTLYSQP